MFLFVGLDEFEAEFLCLFFDSVFVAMTCGESYFSVFVNEVTIASADSVYGGDGNVFGVIFEGAFFLKSSEVLACGEDGMACCDFVIAPVKKSWIF